MYYSNSRGGAFNATINGMKAFSSFFRPVLPAWVASLCGVTGAALFLAGVVCLVAYNWAALGTWLKFAFPLLGLVLCAAGAYYKGLQTGAGKVCSFACGLFAGLFFAVYGQVYQTGAFAYEFCFAWALCLLPLAVLAGNRWLWLLWAAVANGYLLSYYGPFLYRAGTGTVLFLWVFALNAVCFAFAERAWFKTRRGGWFSLFFLAALLAACFVRGLNNWGPWFWACLCLILLFAVYAYAFRRGAAQLGFCALAADCLLAERIVSELRVGGFLVTVVALLLLFVASAWGVYMVSRGEEQHA